ncbi:NADP-dependent oxidoreductase [Tsukamurella asaccharolytica]|uniref:NADP-dependent oxidoreductase n=1 Tax=Tsukamurella asaccharolytica TaxID=2592067 RepID=A0A5C5R738_9ACTN|nr:NADP-dependent oxidoreductase [Tsukamurella asaccharolytica]TWS18432.1 NADP-dependent oxidoreductase [Tsukamurella asaccharolytica]
MNDVVTEDVDGSQFVAREVHLASRPDGPINSSNFEIVERTVARSGPGSLVVRNEYISVDPYMRRRMDGSSSYISPFQIGAAMPGAAVGRVTDSVDPDFPVGSWVLHDYGWRDYAVLPAKRATKIDAETVPPSYYLGVLGISGVTAYVGLREVAGLRRGDTLFVSGAGGAVGSIAGQIGRLCGAHVIGSAGSDAKCQWLVDDLGFDKAINYRSGPIADSLAAAAPNGIDVYFDNVGFDHLEAALQVANNSARFAICGTVADYDTAEDIAGVRNIFEIVAKRITIRGFLVADYWDRVSQILPELLQWVKDGDLVARETVVTGLDEATSALSSMLHGGNVGKMLVKV